MVGYNFSCEHYPEYKENKLIIGALITDLFYEFIEEEYSHISQNEILEFLGVPQKKIDFNDVVVYPLKDLRKTLKNYNKSEVYDIVEKNLEKTDFGDHEYA